MYDRIQHLPPKSFKRKCGVRRDTFEKMVEVLKPNLTRSGKRGGQGKFRVEDQLLIVMEYWREYRTFLLKSLLTQSSTEGNPPTRLSATEGNPLSGLSASSTLGRAGPRNDGGADGAED